MIINTNLSTGTVRCELAQQPAQPTVSNHPVTVLILARHLLGHKQLVIDQCANGAWAHLE